MSLSAAFYQVFYQNEQLFQVEEAFEIKEKTGTIVQNLPQPEPQPEQRPEVLPPVTQAPAAALPATPAIPVKPAENFPALKHKILILIDEPKRKEMIASEAIFLDNILKAVGNSVENSDVLNFSFLPSPDAGKVLTEKRTNYFLTFGVPLIKLNLDLLLVPYTPKNVDGIWFLLTDPLAVIEADRNLKKKLWQALQQMF
ncbi:hypothetical protein [Dyadobacter sediminis]|uniref:Uncharacterized protein n=1 Tax=Dyadobacter sediminis TaxID=1493691 RepID=A0A5R9KD78_9BACT|nr:hypothetical protein [Dyadobacter sediminis]TLU94100.1 hypothetical protein FEM55_07505 [Dyadobacter sediminis]GGB94241.1 hypothetical protein GCM10011325_22080 [Dyadobacter sediminis]